MSRIFPVLPTMSAGFRQYATMACVRDIFYMPTPRNHVQGGPFSGPFKQWIEWMEWSSMHGLEHFLIYTFEGTDLATKDLMTPHLDAGIASRVHFQFYHRSNLVRFGRLMNDCIYRAKNHAKWLATSVDVDEYMVFPGRVKYFNWDHILKEQGKVSNSWNMFSLETKTKLCSDRIFCMFLFSFSVPICFTEGVSEDKVASLELARVRFARARPETYEISSDHRVPSLDERPKQVINVENVYRTSIHWLTCSKNGTDMIHVDSKLAIINHYRIPEQMRTGDYYHFNFQDPYATMKDEGLSKEMPLLETALAKRFNIQTADVKDFLKNLAQRHPPATDIAAAHHLWFGNLAGPSARFRRQKNCWISESFWSLGLQKSTTHGWKSEMLFFLLFAKTSWFLNQRGDQYFYSAVLVLFLWWGYIWVSHSDSQGKHASSIYLRSMIPCRKSSGFKA